MDGILNEDDPLAGVLSRYREKYHILNIRFVKYLRYNKSCKIIKIYNVFQAALAKIIGDCLEPGGKDISICPHVFR